MSGVAASARDLPEINCSTTRLRNLYEEHTLADLLELDEPFVWDDIDRPHEEVKPLQNKLLMDGIIVEVGERPVRRQHGDSRNTVYLKEYIFPKSVREFLERYRDSVTRFECGHRAHVHHDDDGELACRFCGASVSRERIEEADHL